MNPDAEKFDALIQKKLDGELTTEEVALLRRLEREHTDWDADGELAAYDALTAAYRDADFPEPAGDFQPRLLKTIRAEESLHPKARLQEVSPLAVAAVALLGLGGLAAAARILGLPHDAGWYAETAGYARSVLSALSAAAGAFADVLAAPLQNPDAVFGAAPSAGVLCAILAGLGLLWTIMNALFVKKIRAELS